MKKKRIAYFLVGILALGSFALTLGPIAAFQGFHDDTGEGCLGIDDPFCSDGGSGACFSCHFDLEGPTGTVSCVSGTHGRTCETWTDSEGAKHCSTDDPCS